MAQWVVRLTSNPVVGKTTPSKTPAVSLSVLPSLLSTGWFQKIQDRFHNLTKIN